MPIFPGRNVRPFERIQTTVLAEHGVAAGRISMGEHQGTHIDAPCHFVDSPTTADRIPVAHLVAEAVVIDISPAASRDPEYRLRAGDVDRWESAHGRVPDSCFVLVSSGWSARWSDPARYVNADDGGVPRHPACTPEAAALLVERGVLGVGVDTLSVDNATPSDVRAPAHKVLHGADRYVIENLARLDELPARDIVLVIGALPIVAGTAGPARVLAFC